MRHRVRDVQKERLIPVPPDEIDSPASVIAGQFGLQDRVLHDGFVLHELDRSHVVGVENPVVLVKALRAWQVLGDMAKVPLPDRSRGVP